MDIQKTSISGCYLITPKIFKDARGVFVKTFYKSTLEENGLRTDFVEDYYSISDKNVLRGLHFQTPPKDHAKLVYCVNGSVVDVVLDIRKGSPTYKQYLKFELSAENANMVYIAAGLAHGFLAISSNTIMMYKVTSEYAASNDSGILWSSAHITWPVQEPIMSDRDKKFIALDEYDSPFKYED